MNAWHDRKRNHDRRRTDLTTMVLVAMVLLACLCEILWIMR